MVPLKAGVIDQRTGQVGAAGPTPTGRPTRTIRWPTLGMTTPVSSGAVFTLMPLMAAFFGWLFLGQVPRPLVIGSLLVAACGALWMIFRGSWEAFTSLDIGKGELIFMVGVAGHAAYAPLVRRFNRGEPLVAFTFWSLAAIGTWIAIYGFRDILATDWTAVPAIVWATILYLAIFTTALTTFLVQFATMRLPASKVLAYNYLTPGFIILIEGLLGHGWASPKVLIGAAITVGGLLVMALAPD
jgi:drug/metabolite transporter (DMT)-like permease